MRGFLTAFLAGLLILSTLSGCGARARDEDQIGPAERIVIKFSHVVAEQTPKGLAARRFANLVSVRTGGRVEVQVFPNAQLYGDGEELDALRQGSVHIIAPSVSKLSEIVPQWQVFDLPFAFPDESSVVAAMDGEVGRKLFSLLKQRGMLGLAMWDNGFKQMTNNLRPLRVPGDFSGARFRIQPSRTLAEQFKTVGARAVPLAFSDTYSALAEGKVDGQENTLSNIYSKRFYRVQKYMTISNHGYLGYAVITNARFWEGLPPDLRAILEKCLAETTTWVRGNAAEINQSSLEQIRASERIEIHELTEGEKRLWMRAMDQVYETFAHEIGADLIQSVKALRKR